MSIAFTSNHLGGDFAAGLLVDLAIEDARQGVTRYDRLSFGVPPDFHAHPDVLAAALLAIVGPNYPSVRFNFAISPACAELLGAFYQLDGIGPVDHALAPRRPGRHLGLSFSGGTDSLAVYLLLRRLGVDFKVVTADFGGWLENERGGYARLQRDITCPADFRVKGYGSHSPFLIGAVAILFADYLDLGGLTFGLKLDEHRGTLERPRPGAPPAFQALARPLHAAGLEHVYVSRCLMTPAVIQTVRVLAPDLLETGLLSAARPGSQKYFRKATLARWLYLREGAAVPPFLRSIPPPRGALPFGHDIAEDMSALLFARHLGLDVAEQAAPGIARIDLGFLRELSLDFYLKYNPNYIDLIPAAFRDALLGTWHALGFYPYDERDWQELDAVRDFLDASRARAAGERWLTPQAAQALLARRDHPL